MAGIKRAYKEEEEEDASETSDDSYYSACSSPPQPQPPPPTPPLLPPRKRRCLSYDENGVTGAIYRQFRHLHNINYSYAQFVGICAYLHSVLLGNYRIREEDMDLFVCEHERYTDIFCNPARRPRCAVSKTSPLAYHRWFIDNKSHTATNTMILSAARLRTIYREQPLAFLFAEQSLAAIRTRTRPPSPATVQRMDTSTGSFCETNAQRKD